MPEWLEIECLCGSIVMFRCLCGWWMVPVWLIDYWLRPVWSGCWEYTELMWIWEVGLIRWEISKLWKLRNEEIWKCEVWSDVLEGFWVNIMVPTCRDGHSWLIVGTSYSNCVIIVQWDLDISNEVPCLLNTQRINNQCGFYYIIVNGSQYYVNQKFYWSCQVLQTGVWQLVSTAPNSKLTWSKYSNSLNIRLCIRKSKLI